MNCEKYDVYKSAYIPLKGHQYSILSGIKVNHEDFSFEFVTSIEPILCKLYEEAVSFNIVACEGNHRFLFLINCRLTQQDLAVNQTMLCRGKFLSKCYFMDSD